MNKLAVIMISLLVLVEIVIGDTVVLGIPLWLLGLITFSFIWIIVVCIKDNVQIKDYY